jgi:hypothetical protein
MVMVIRCMAIPMLGLFQYDVFIVTSYWEW